MATMPARRPFMLFKVAIMVCALFSFLAWILLLAGISAVQDEFNNNGGGGTRLGLYWFVVWFQLVLIIPVIFVELIERFGAWRPVLHLLLAINTAVCMILCDTLFQIRDGYTSDTRNRINVAISGFILICIFNLLLIILGGSRTALNTRYGEDRDVGVATYPTNAKAAPTHPNSAPPNSMPVPVHNTTGNSPV